MKKLALFLALLMAVCSFSAINVSAGELFVSAGTTTLPDEGGESSMLIGWTYKDGENTVVLAPGASFTAESDITLEPLYLDMTMVGGASVRTATPAGLRFTTDISEPHYQALVATGAKFELGTIIAPYDYITDEFTYEALKSADKDCLKIPCKIFWGHTDEVRTYTGVISNLFEENYNRDFSARAYVTVTYTDGSEKTFYSAFDNSANTRTAYSVSCSAISDASASLSEDALSVLQSYIDSVGIDITYPKPVVGEAPAAPVNSINGAHYSISHDWMCKYDTEVPTIFRNDRGYQITITITAAEGIEFTKNTIVRLRGKVVKEGAITRESDKITIIQRHPLGNYTWPY